MQGLSFPMHFSAIPRIPEGVYQIYPTINNKVVPVWKTTVPKDMSQLKFNDMVSYYLIYGDQLKTKGKTVIEQLGKPTLVFLGKEMPKVINGFIDLMAERVRKQSIYQKAINLIDQYLADAKKRMEPHKQVYLDKNLRVQKFIKMKQQGHEISREVMQVAEEQAFDSGIREELANAECFKKDDDFNYFVRQLLLRKDKTFDEIAKSRALEKLGRLISRSKTGKLYVELSQPGPGIEVKAKVKKIVRDPKPPTDPADWWKKT